MKRLSLNLVAEAVKGEVYNFKENIEIIDIATDTRKDIKDMLFIPIKGEKYDGHMFIHMAIEKGVSCIITETDINSDITYIKVKDSNQAIMDLAEYYRSLFDITVVAITGSIGKTTTKDMVASVLSQKYKVLKTDGNLNNEIGLPLMIFKLEEDTEIAVLEMGMNSFGEIHNLSKIVKPDVCLITNIGIAHIGNLGSREGIFKAKCEIFDYMKPDGKAILNGDDDMLKSLADKDMNTYYYSKDDKKDYIYVKESEAKGLLGTKCTFASGNEEISIDIPLPGEHMIYNALAATTAGLLFDVKIEDIFTGIKDFKISKNRMDIKYLEEVTIINDVYNASPASVISMVKILELALGRKVCVLGDMLELGDKGENLHYEVGAELSKMDINVAIFIGELCKKMYEGAVESTRRDNVQKDLYYFENKEDFLIKGLDILRNSDSILVKASRGMEFEKILDAFLCKYN